MFSANLVFRPARTTTPEVQEHSSPTPAARMVTIASLAEDPNWRSQRINFAALTRYYQEGNRCPIGEEELWAINGELSWGIRRSIQDFDREVFLDRKVPILCERLNASKLIFEDNGASRRAYFNWDRHPVLVARSVRLDCEQRLRNSLQSINKKPDRLQKQRLEMEAVLAKCRDDDFRWDKQAKRLASSGDHQKTTRFRQFGPPSPSADWPKEWVRRQRRFADE